VPVLLVDAANVIGSRPTGWWRDRAGAARHLVDRIAGAAAADRIPKPVVIVLEGAAREGSPAGASRGVEVVHAQGSGDDTLVSLAAEAGAGADVLLVTADRGLRARAAAVGASAVGPSWLLDRLE
jgi:rRNA-processing protein FCF1